jgi:hypothetical protein
MERVCLYCDKAIRVGRADKKFCNGGCKDAYYNAIRSEEQAEISKIDRILKRNRRVLKKLYDESESGKKLVSWEQLIRQGFEFKFYTHVVDSAIKSKQVTFCYDYGYCQTPEFMKYSDLLSWNRLNRFIVCLDVGILFLYYCNYVHFDLQVIVR